MPTPTYTIQQEPAWRPSRVSTAPTVSSVYSDGYENAIPGSHAMDVPELKMKDSYHPSYHAHPRQEINDHGPQVRQSRLPIFKQVRSMLHKPPPLATPGNPKWDEYTGELSERGKPSSVQPSNYTSPYDGAFKAYRKRSPDGNKKSKKNLSPVSVLRDEEIQATTPVAPVPALPDDTEWSPVSPVSPVSRMTKDTWERDDISEIVPDMMPEPLSPNVQRPAQSQATPPGIKQTIIKRKPVSRCVSTAENYPPTSPQHSPSQSSDISDRMIDDKDLPPEPETEAEGQSHHKSHFSWTTYAPSVAPGRQSIEPGRQSIDTVATRNLRSQQVQPTSRDPKSHFSWSTVATNMNPNQTRTQQEPSSPPPPVPSKFTSPPVQSILSRRRPIQRMEEQEWAPPPRQSSRQTSNSNTPTSAKTLKPLPLPKDNTPTSSRQRSPAPNTPGSSGKALPPPPGLEASDLTHLESLLAQERSIILQRRNVEKGIKELEKIEKASPLDVSFGAVRDAKKRLEEYRKRLAEVKLEERDLGIAIARARRKDEKENGGDGESLWVRRVTG